MNLPLFLSKRIYRDTSDGKQVSRPAVLIAMIGIAIGLAVAILILKDEVHPAKLQKFTSVSMEDTL